MCAIWVATAGRFNAFCTEHLNPLLNFHRPCLFPTEINDPKKLPGAIFDDACVGPKGGPWMASPKKPGRIKRICRHQDVKTPQLASLSHPEQFLRPGISLQALQQQARQLNDRRAFNA